jgi:protein-S-isoprenylcysteine O-methyltransferase Ste14
MEKVAPIARSILFAALFISLQMWLLPRWVGIRGYWHAPQEEPWRWTGLLLLVLGSALMLTAVWRFGTAGQGTPMPLDSPRKFVVVGPYRYVRNPMYLGMAVALVGEALLFADWSRANAVRIGWYALALMVITNLFVLFYEEPALRNRFGAEYEEYRRRVNRWWPKRGGGSDRAIG